jgi:hypothetical protein
VVLQVQTDLGRNGRWCQIPCGQAKSDDGRGDRCDHRRDGSSHLEEDDLAGSDRWQQASVSGDGLSGCDRRVRDGGLDVLVVILNAIVQGTAPTGLWRATSLSVLVGGPVLVAITSRDTRQRRSIGCAARVVAVCVHCEDRSCCSLILGRGCLSTAAELHGLRRSNAAALEEQGLIGESVARKGRRGVSCCPLSCSVLR